MRLQNSSPLAVKRLESVGQAAPFRTRGEFRTRSTDHLSGTACLARLSATACLAQPCGAVGAHCFFFDSLLLFSYIFSYTLHLLLLRCASMTPHILGELLIISPSVLLVALRVRPAPTAAALELSAGGRIVRESEPLAAHALVPPAHTAEAPCLARVLVGSPRVAPPDSPPTLHRPPPSRRSRRSPPRWSR